MYLINFITCYFNDIRGIKDKKKTIICNNFYSKNLNIWLLNTELSVFGEIFALVNLTTSRLAWKAKFQHVHFRNSRITGRPQPANKNKRILKTKRTSFLTLSWQRDLIKNISGTLRYLITKDSYKPMFINKEILWNSRTVCQKEKIKLKQSLRFFTNYIVHGWFLLRIMIMGSLKTPKTFACD